MSAGEQAAEKHHEGESEISWGEWMRRALRGLRGPVHTCGSDSYVGPCDGCRIDAGRR